MSSQETLDDDGGELAIDFWVDKELESLGLSWCVPSSCEERRLRCVDAKRWDGEEEKTRRKREKIESMICWHVFLKPT